MEVIIRGGSGMCPRCSGLLRALPSGEEFKCVDCKAYFTAEAAGYDKYGLIVRERKGVCHE